MLKRRGLPFYMMCVCCVHVCVKERANCISLLLNSSVDLCHFKTSSRQISDSIYCCCAKYFKYYTFESLCKYVFKHSKSPDDVCVCLCVCALEREVCVCVCERVWTSSILPASPQIHQNKLINPREVSDWSHRAPVCFTVYGCVFTCVFIIV